MSFLKFQQQCTNCAATWNAAFGIVGSAQIAAPPKECPHCGSKDIKKIADGWAEKPAPPRGSELSLSD